MDIVQVAAIAIAAGMRVDDLAGVPLSFPTYAEILFNAAASAAFQLNKEVGWQAQALGINSENDKRRPQEAQASSAGRRTRCGSQGTSAAPCDAKIP